MADGIGLLSQLGVDPNSLGALQELVGKLGPTEEDKRMARAQAAILAGLGMMGARKNALPQDLSRAAMLGVQDYSQNLKEIGQQRMQAIGQAASLYPLLQKADTSRLFDMGTQTTPQQIPGFGMQDRSSGTMPPPLATQPGKGSPLVEAMRDAGITDAEIALIAKSNNPQGEALKALAEYRKPILGQNKVPMFRTRNGVESVLPSGALANTAAMTGIETAATEAAKSQYDLVDVPLSNGQMIKMPKADALRFLGQGQGPSQMPAQVPAQAPAQLPQVMRNVTGTPEQQAASHAIINADVARGAGGMLPQMGGTGSQLPQLGMTANPVSQLGAMEAVKTGAEAQREVNKGAIGQVDKQYETVSNSATNGIALVHDARAMIDSGKVVTGMGANIALNFGRALSQAGFDKAKDPVANTQAFMATQARQVLTIIKSLGSGSGISDQDREYAAKIVGGDISIDEGAIRRLLDISERAQRNNIDAHNARVDRATKVFNNPDLRTLYTVEQPPPYQKAGNAASSNSPTVGEVRKGYRFKGGDPSVPSNWERQ